MFVNTLFNALLNLYLHWGEEKIESLNWEIPMSFKLSFSLFLSFFYFFLFPLCGHTQPIVVFTQDTVIATLPTDFYGIQYHGNTYDQPTALQQLRRLHIKPVRVWAKVNIFHPQPGQWDWQDLDVKINEILAADMEPVVCLYQSEQWFTGDSENPWWNDSTARAEWQEAAYRLASRYQNQVRRFIIFDEINMMHPEDGYYITFQNSARLYCAAAEKIKQVNPDLQCGGPSSFGGWENAHWAQYVLKEPQGPQLLDFISCNLFLSWNADDADSLLMDRTIWYQEAPLSIASILGEQTPPVLLLDAYNVSALWKKDGQLWTDPRNTNFFGGIYQVLALLHAAQGGFKITLHWETLGGYGIFDWYPQFNPLPPYDSWRFLIEIGGLQAGSELLVCRTSQTPRANVQHLSGMQVPSYAVQPFAVRQADSVLSVILIHKFQESAKEVHLIPPPGMPYFRQYRFDAQNQANCFEPLRQGRADTTLVLNLPPQSITIVKFYAHPLALPSHSGKVPFTLKIERIDPNPFNGAVAITLRNTRSETVRLEIFNVLGKRVATPFTGVLAAGVHRVVWRAGSTQGRSLPSGLYFCRVTANGGQVVRKLVYLR